jgi:hypothetical protein
MDGGMRSAWLMCSAEGMMPHAFLLFRTVAFGSTLGDPSVARYLDVSF